MAVYQSRGDGVPLAWMVNLPVLLLCYNGRAPTDYIILASKIGFLQTMALLWHVIRSKPNREDFLARELESRAVEVYFPCLRVHPVNPRARRYKPYFPGYLFIHVDLDQTNPSAFERVPGAANLVSFGGEVSSIPDNMVHAIRCKVDEINASGGEKAEEWHPGDVVEIDQGPFAGYSAILDATLSGSERVRVLLRMLQKRELPVEMPSAYIHASQKRGKPSGMR